MKTDQKPLNSGFGAKTTPEEIVSGIDLRDTVCVITGGHSGIGLPPPGSPDPGGG
jgi:hypothetical protein